MSYIFSSNGNNYTFKKLDNMLINMPEKDGKHILVRETVDGIPQYSWMADTSCLVKVNNATLFEHTLTFTQSFNNQWKFELHSNYIWLILRLHVTMRMNSHSMNMIQLNRLLVRVTK